MKKSFQSISLERKLEKGSCWRGSKSLVAIGVEGVKPTATAIKARGILSKNW